MSGSRHFSNLRKRRSLEQHPLQQNETSQPQSKRRRLGHHSSRSHYPPAFWDSLSKVWLTKDALNELDRRNIQSVPRQPPPYREAHRPVTRRFANLKPTLSSCDFLHNCALSTLKDIKRFARHGGPDLSALKGYPEPINPLNHIMRLRSSTSRHRKRPSTSTSRSRPATTNTTVTKSSRPRDPNYQQKLIDSGIFPYGYEYPDDRRPPLPLNWDEISQRLAQHRPSLLPSMFPEEEYKEFIRADAKAFNEDDVKDSVLPAMLKAMSAFNGAQKNVIFNNVDPITDYIALAKPDYYYGAQPEQIHQDVRNQLSKDIVPSKHSHLPAVPNLFLEAKGPDGSLAEAQRQALHDGTIGARAMQSIQSYRQEKPIFKNNIYTISSIYHGGQLKMYGHSVAQPNGPRTRPEYYMYQLRSFAMTDTVDSFRQGAITFKNARDWTTECRNAAIARANEMAVQTTEEEEEEDEAETDDDQAEAESSKTMFSFDCGTSQVPSLPVADEDESETSVEDGSQSRLPAKRSSSKSHQSHQRKRSSSKSHQSHQRKRKTGRSDSRSAATGTHQNNRWSWWKW